MVGICNLLVNDVNLWLDDGLVKGVIVWVNELCFIDFVDQGGFVVVG